MLILATIVIVLLISLFTVGLYAALTVNKRDDESANRIIRRNRGEINE